MVKSYRKNPVTVKALQWTGTNVQEVWDWIGADNFYGPLPVGDDLYPAGTRGRLYVAANDAWLDLEPSEWIIQDKLGYYPCKDSVFKESYGPQGSPNIGEQLKRIADALEQKPATMNVKVVNPKDELYIQKTDSMLMRIAEAEPKQVHEVSSLGMIHGLDNLIDKHDPETPANNEKWTGLQES